MQRTLTQFIKALRSADVRVSPAETLDAFAALQLVGFRNRALLKHSLAAVLAKSAPEKTVFDACFERYFQVAAIGHFDDGGDDEAIAPSCAPAADPAAAESRLAQLLLAEDRSQLTTSMIAAAQTAGLQNIVLFTQKGLYAQRILQQLGLDELQSEIFALERSGQPAAQLLSAELRRRRDRLRVQVQDYVEQQFWLYADVSGRQLREELLRKAKLAHIERRYFEDMRDIVRRMAKKLVALHSRRKKRERRGQLHMARTLRHNMAYDGTLFRLYWKKIKIERPQVFAICDVSGSVASYARFMLMFLYSLEEVLPKVRAFAFSSNLGEVTGLFEQQPLEAALQQVLYDYGGGSTDYGQALLDFKRIALDAVDARSTVIMLGDSRNNYGNPRSEILRELHDRCKRLIWLNPEPRSFWHTGDAEMQRYSAYCHQVEPCNSLRHLERIIGRLLES